jgi:ribonuclease-3
LGTVDYDLLGTVGSKGMGSKSRRGTAELQEAVGHEFRDADLLETALTHRSYANEHPKEQLKSNERLEFLGDAVLELAVSHLLMEAHAEQSEGVLSRWRAALVNEKSLAQKARAMGLGDYLRLGKGEERTFGREKDSLLADAYEGLLAAIYLDGGFEKALQIIRRQFHQEVVEHPWDVADEDFKTRLQEYTQSLLKVIPRYALVGEEGPDHDKLFHVKLQVGEGLISFGHGRSKKEAEQQAAREMLARLATDAGSAEQSREP